MDQPVAMSATDRIAVVIAKILVFFRWPVVILGLASVAAAGYGAQNLGFSNNYRYFFAPENPQFQAFTELQNVYSKRDNLAFVLKPKNGTVFTRETLTAVRWLTDEGWKLPFVLRADSIANYQHTEAQGDDLIVADLVKDPASLDQTGLDRVKQIATNEPLLKDRIIAPNGLATGVVLTMVMPDKSPTEATTAMAAARKLVSEFRTRYPDVQIRLSGTVALSNAFSEATQADITTLVPLMYLVVALTSLVLLRSFGAMFCVMIVLSMATVAAMGLAGWLHMTLTPPSALAPVIILTLAIAESVHVIHNFLHELGHGRTRFEAVIESTRVNFGAITLTSVTNAVGFLSLNAADAPPFRDLGNIVSLGVLTTWVYALLFLPALLAILPIGKQGKLIGDEGGGFMRFLANFVIKLRIPLAVSLTAVTIWLGMQVPKIELNDQFVNWFDRSIEFRRNTDFMIEHLTGIYTVDYSIKSGESNGITNPQFLNKVEDFANWARAQEHVLHVFTITDIMKRLNKNLNADNPAFYKVPDDRQLAAQYLLLYELSLPLGLDLNDTINVDKSATRVIVTLKGVVSAVDTRAFKAKADAWIAANVPTSKGSEGASPAVMFSFIAQRNIDANLFGTGWAMVAISFLLIVPFRSIRLGLISLIPNIVPIVMTFGVWYFLVGRLGMASSVVTATSLGIVVDSTIHLLSKYIRGRRELNLSPEDSVRYSFSTVGPALWILTAALILGFLVLSLSPFEVNRAMGLLTAICIAFAIVADFFLLPPLLMLVDRRRKDRAAAAAAAPAE
ncbi:MAG: MMPL family transporter [Alphaproteobacteria bacterium]|nr:MMPL family transporter [Alphaproteobacteria bacterium]